MHAHVDDRFLDGELGSTRSKAAGGDDIVFDAQLGISLVDHEYRLVHEDGSSRPDGPIDRLRYVSSFGTELLTV